MIGSMVSFLGSGAGGALLGFIMDWMAERRESKAKAEDNALKKDLAYHDQLKNHNEALDRGSDAKVYPVNFKFHLWGFRYETTRHRPIYSPRARVVAYSLWLLVSTYCAILLLWAGNPWEIIYSLDPSATPTRWGIPWLFMVEHAPSSNPVEQNAGGVVFLMLHSLNFLINTAVVGVSRNALRRNR